MKKSLLAAAIVSGAFLAGCATPEGYAVVFSDKTRPLTATGDKIGSKTGQATSENILGIIAQGDAGVVAAARNGGITKVSTVDVKGWNILGFYAKGTTIVTGE